jgi:hypothetical protein
MATAGFDGWGRRYSRRGQVAAADRDSTEDWLVPESGLGPPGSNGDPADLTRAIGRLDDRLEAVAASADAAGDLAEQADAAASQAQRRVEAVADRVGQALAKLEARERATVRRATEAEHEQQTLRSFEARADRVVLRLRELERRSLDLATNGPAGRPVG